MQPLNVLIVTPTFERAMPRASEETIRQISLAAPGISVKDASALVTAELHGDQSVKAELDAMLAWTDVIFGLMLPPDVVERSPRLKWVQMMSAGVDRLTRTDVWQSDVTITGVSGIHATPIGEFVMAEMLMLVKGAPQFFRMKQTREWHRFPARVLRGKTVGIVGLGHIGREVARLANAFGMRVIATRRSARKEARGRYVDSLVPAAQLHRLLAESDFVVISVPLTHDTTKLIGEAEFKAMKPTAYIINIARGGIIDEAALLRALEEKRIAGAGLDVTAMEPLPPGSKLWDFENVILSPHIAGGMEDYVKLATDLFCENIRRYLGGKKLINLVDRKRGY